MNLDAAQKIKDLFETQNFPYKLIKHQPTLTSVDSAAARAAGGSPEACGAKAILTKMSFKDRTEYNVLVLPSNRQIHTKTVKKGLKVRSFRFVSREEMDALVSLQPGEMPPFSGAVFPRLDHLYIDPALKEQPVLGFNLATLTCSMIVQLDHYLQVAKPTGFPVLTRESVIK